MSMPQATSTGSEGACSWSLRFEPSRNRWLRQGGEIAAGDGGELGPDLLAHPAHRGARQGRLVAKDLPQGGPDVATRWAAHSGREDERFEGCRARHADPEELQPEPLVGSAQLRAAGLYREIDLERAGRLSATAESDRRVLAATLIGRLPRSTSISASIAWRIGSRPVRRPTSSRTVASSRTELDSASGLAWKRFLRDIRGATGQDNPRDLVLLKGPKPVKRLLYSRVEMRLRSDCRGVAHVTCRNRHLGRWSWLRAQGRRWTCGGCRTAHRSSLRGVWCRGGA